MTKAENRAAAKAWHDERQRQHREDQHKANVATDLQKLGEFRDYFQRGRKVVLHDDNALIVAIDDYAERLTGDRKALHSKMATWGSFSGR